MEKNDFNSWLSLFRDSIADYKYYVDFDIVYKNIEKKKERLSVLNTLVGSEDIERDFRILCKEHPEVIEAIPLLIAKRETNIYCTDKNGGVTYDFSLGKNNKESISNSSLDELCYFMRETGLFNLLTNHSINSVLDYSLGIEVGLSANGRKNRGGDLMENLVESFIEKAGFIRNKSYFKEMNLSALEKMTGLDLSKLSNEGETEKRFDFVIISEKCIYGCECNFYSSKGSKLNETARSYKTLALEAKDIQGFKFVWFTDGSGWFSAKNNLKETFDILDDIYCIKELEEGILKDF